MTYARINYRHKGYVYKPWDDSDSDCTKIFHTVVLENCGLEMGLIPLGPYHYATEEVFRAWIDAEMPSREQVNMSIHGHNTSNPSGEDIINYYLEQVLVK